MNIRTLFVFCALFCAVHLSAQTDKSWVGTWAASAEFTGPSDMPARPLTNRSLREIVKVSIGGECLTLRLSNEFSKQPVEIKSVFIADALDSCDIVKKSAQYLTFGGRRNVTIPAGECVVSDVCKYSLKPLQRLSVTISYGSTPENATSHRGSRTTSYIIDGVAKPKTSFAVSERVDHWYSIAAIDVPASGQECIAILGNSITDGRGSTTNLQNRWPDVMSEALGKAGFTCGVLNLGIGGNCVLAGGLSEPAVKRFDRDILGQKGVTKLILFEGVNDIGGANGRSERVAHDLVEAYKQFIQKAHERGIKVYVATITPFGKSFYDGGNLFKEACRQTVNQWMRTSSEVDGVIDFDALMRDPDAPNQLRQSLQEDWLHPNSKGYEEMGRFAAKYFQGH